MQILFLRTYYAYYLARYSLKAWASRGLAIEFNDVCLMGERDAFLGVLLEK